MVADAQAHHILAEIIQGGLVLETNGDEISNSGPYKFSSSSSIMTAHSCVFKLDVYVWNGHA
jgi:hypothetical protein